MVAHHFEHSRETRILPKKTMENSHKIDEFLRFYRKILHKTILKLQLFNCKTRYYL
jgi:hypothetical protein